MYEHNQAVIFRNVGNVASKSVSSVEMLKCGLEKLNEVLDLLEYSALNLLSCMTLDVENIHSVVHHTEGPTLDSAAKDGLKRTIHWVAHYFTNPKSWCPGTCHGSFSHASHATFATCSDATTMRAKHEGLCANVWCSRTSTIC